MDPRIREMAWKMFYLQRLGVAGIEVFLNRAYLLGKDDAVEYQNLRLIEKVGSEVENGDIY
jgi:hypothetical protein